MNKEDNIILGDTVFLILCCEHSTIFQPNSLGISPTWSNDTDFEYHCTYELKEFQLYLKDLIISSDRSYPVINGVIPEPYYTENGKETVQYNSLMEPMKYTGAIIIANQFINNYGTYDKAPSYCYKFVREMFFQEGKLVTSIDHSKAMLRIRKNLDTGLRNLDKKRDVKCIQHFIKSSFAGDYDEADRNILNKLKTMLHNQPYVQYKRKRNRKK